MLCQLRLLDFDLCLLVIGHSRCKASWSCCKHKFASTTTAMVRGSVLHECLRTRMSHYMSQCLVAALCLIAVSSAIARLRPLPSCLLQQAACRSVHTSRHITAMLPQNVHSICKDSCAAAGRSVHTSRHVTAMLPQNDSKSTTNSSVMSHIGAAVSIEERHGNVCIKCAKHLSIQ